MFGLNKCRFFVESPDIYSSSLYQILMNCKPILSHDMHDISQDKHIIIENVQIIACKDVHSYHFCSNIYLHDFLQKRTRMEALQMFDGGTKSYH